MNRAEWLPKLEILTFAASLKQPNLLGSLTEILWIGTDRWVKFLNKEASRNCSPRIQRSFRLGARQAVALAKAARLTAWLVRWFQLVV